MPPPIPPRGAVPRPGRAPIPQISRATAGPARALFEISPRPFFTTTRICQPTTREIPNFRWDSNHRWFDKWPRAALPPVGRASGFTPDRTAYPPNRWENRLMPPQPPKVGYPPTINRDHAGNNELARANWLGHALAGIPAHSRLPRSNPHYRIRYDPPLWGLKPAAHLTLVLATGIVNGHCLGR